MTTSDLVIRLVALCIATPFILWLLWQLIRQIRAKPPTRSTNEGACPDCGKKMVEIGRVEHPVPGTVPPGPGEHWITASCRLLWCACGATRIVIEDPDGALRALWEKENQK